MIQDAVIALVPALQAATHVLARGAGVEPHERVREIIVLEVVLRRKVIGFGLALLAHARGEFVALVQVMGNRAQVVEKLTEQVPPAVLLHHAGGPGTDRPRFRWLRAAATFFPWNSM